MSNKQFTASLSSTHAASHTYISEGDIPGSPDTEGFPVGNVSSGIFFFTLYAMSVAAQHYAHIHTL